MRQYRRLGSSAAISRLNSGKQLLTKAVTSHGLNLGHALSSESSAHPHAFERGANHMQAVFEYLGKVRFPWHNLDMAP